MDIGNRADLFFKKYNIPEQECTLEHKAWLEEIIITMPFLDTIIEDEGKKYPIYKTYSIQYDVDQWWGACAMEVVEINGKYYHKRAFTGEGDSPTYALLALLIEMKKIFSPEQVQAIRNIFIS